MKRADINYWMSPKFDHSPPTDEELTEGRPIGKRVLALLLANDIKTMVERDFSPEQIASKVDQLARMVKDDPEQTQEEDEADHD